MFQLECTQVFSTDSPMVKVRFALLLNGEATNQFTEFCLQPDFCEVGDLFSLTASDFEFPRMRNDLSKRVDSLN